MLPSGPSPATTDEPAGWIYEADPATVRAHALGALCSQHGLLALADTNGLLTGEREVASEWLRGWQVLWHGAYRLKLLTSALQALDARVEVVKPRGVDLAPEAVRKSLGKPKGPKRLTLLIWRRGQSLRCALVEPSGCIGCGL